MVTKNSLTIRLTYSLLLIILLGYLLVIGRDFLFPVAISMLLAFLLYPPSKWLERRGLPRIIALLITIILALGIIGFASYLLYSRLTFFLGDFPALKEKALGNIEALEATIEGATGLKPTGKDHWLKTGIKGFFDNGGGSIRQAISATGTTLFQIGIMPIYVFFMLYYRNKFKDFIYGTVPADRQAHTRMMMEQISEVTKKYVIGMAIVVLVLCVVNSVGLLIVGLEYAILIGIISAFMNFIPFFGSIIGGAIAVTYALVAQGSPRVAFAVLVLFVIIQFFENNILTPSITGGQVRVNPLATILAIILGGMLWGLPGMIVSVPFLAMYKIVCDHIESMKPYGMLLDSSGADRHALTFAKIKTMFHRLTGGKVDPPAPPPPAEPGV